MQISVPATLPYKNPLIGVPSRVMLPPREGNKQIPCQIDWTDYATGATEINIGNNATLEISQISALKIDNSLCGATVTFIFPDTGETVAVPAYSPNTIIEVFSQQTQFYVVAAEPIATDITRFQILNFLPPPVSVSVSTEQQTAIIGNINSGGAGVTPIIPGTVNGTLQGLSVEFGISSPAGDSNAVATFTDGAGKLIARTPVFVKTAIPANVVLLNLTNLAVRFEGGIDCTISGLLIASGEFNVNAYYRIP